MLESLTRAKKRGAKIYAEITGYGSEGPYAHKNAYDLVVQGEAGLITMTGTKDEPAKAGASIADIAAGMYAYTNILAALIQRGRTGKGCGLDISMLEAMAEWMSFPMYYAYKGANPPVRAGAAHATIYPYGPFPAGDGKTVMLGLQNEREWVIFCDKVLQQPALASDSRFASADKRSDARKELYGIIAQAFASLTAEQVIARLDEAQIANARLNDMHELWDHAQLRARQRWTEVATPVGPVPAMLPPGAASGWDARMDAIPALGEHTAAILGELGYANEAVERLRAEKAI